MNKKTATSKRISCALSALGAILLVTLLLPGLAAAKMRQEGRGANLRTVGNLPSKEKRWALIIGVSTYEDSNITPLPGANNDAKALRDALRDYAGFDEKNIILLTTDEPKDRWPTKNNTLRLLGNLSGTVPKDGLLLVAFSGHGIEKQNRAFLLATDTPYNDNVRVLERTAISVQDDVKELIRDTGVRQVIVLLDACRNDPTSGRSDSDNPLTPAFTRGFSFDLRNSEIEAFATLYATSIGARAYEYAREGKGYFTWAFIEGLRGGAANGQGEVTLGSLVRYVERYVSQQVRIDLGGSKNQRPFSIIEGYKAEELVLGIAKNHPTPDTSLSLVTMTGERTYWQETQALNTIAAYERYLSEYPDGEFAKVARIRIGSQRWTHFKPAALQLLKYEAVGPFSEGLAEVGSNGKHGFIDTAGRLVVSLKYDEVSAFSEGLAVVSLKRKHGFIDKAGKEVIPLKYDGANSFQGGLAHVEMNGRAGFIDRAGKEVIPIKYGHVVYSPSRNLIWVGVSLFSQYRVLNKAGEEVIPLTNYDSVYEFSDGIACVASNRKYGFIDATGKEIVPLKYESAYIFKEGRAAVKTNGKWGFVDGSGKEVVPPKYDAVGYSFSDGLAAVCSNGKCGFIDRAGREVIPLKYDYTDNFSEGVAAVRIRGKWGHIDMTGGEIAPFIYDRAERFWKGVARVAINDRWGFVNRQGRQVVPLKYDDLSCYHFGNEDFIGVKVNDRKGFIDLYGNEYFDIQ